MTPPVHSRTTVAESITALPATLPNVVVGFDGFVDEMISVVGERKSLAKFDPVEEISTFGALITAAAGQSSLREIVVNAVHPGGCAVNLGDGLCAMGVPVDCFATLGEPVHRAFSELAESCRSCHSWGNEPGRTLAFEFKDGKLMFSSVRQLADFTPDHVERMLAGGSYAAACATAGVIALTDWTLYPHMTGVWKLLQDKVFSQMQERSTRRHIFIDLVDPSGRTGSDILSMLEVLSKFENYGATTLGLNGNEANIVARVLEVMQASGEEEDFARLADELRERLGIACIVVHKTRFAVASSAEGNVAVQGPYCAAPLKSTGAGDRFNAGFCLGLLGGMDLHSCLTMGCASSGFFVRNARSATRNELVSFLSNWDAGNT